MEEFDYKVKTLNYMLKFLRPYKYHSDMKLKLKRLTLETITKALMNRLYGYRVNESKQKKLLISHTMSLISEFLVNKSKGKLEEKMLIFSGHDSNINNFFANILDEEYMTKKILNSVKDINDRNFLVPPLASSILLELIQVNGQKTFYVRIIYNGVNITEGFALNLRKYGKYDLLDFNDFNKLINSRIDNDYKTMNCSKTLDKN